MTDAIEPGWYRDPVDETVQRYWNGEEWIGEPIPADATPPAAPPTPPSPPDPATPQVAAPSPPDPPTSQVAAPSAPDPATPQAAVPPDPPTAQGTVTEPGAGQPFSATRLPPQPGAAAPAMIADRPLAPVGARLAARIVDVLAVFALNVVVNGWFVYQWWLSVAETLPQTRRWVEGRADELPPPSDRSANLQWAIMLIALALWFAYEVPTQASSGQTLGKRLLGIAVTRLDGAVPGFRISMARWSFMGVPNLLWPCLMPLQVFDALRCTWDRTLRQCLHDRIFGTVVVQLAPGEQLNDEKTGTEDEASREDDHAHRP